MFGDPCAKQPQPQVLGDVGVLILVDQDVAEAAMIVGEHVGVLAEQPQAFEQQIAEIAGVEILEPRLIGGIKLRPLAVSKRERFALRNFVRRQSAVFPAIDQARELACGPAILVDPRRLDHLLQEPDLIVVVENREARLQTDEFGVAAENFDADGMERAEPLHAFERAADQRADPLAHFARGLVRECDGENLRRISPAGRQNVGDAGRQYSGFAGSGAGEDEQRAFRRLDGFALFGIEAFEVRRLATRGRHGTGRNRQATLSASPARMRGGGFGKIERRIVIVVRQICACRQVRLSN